MRSAVTAFLGAWALVLAWPAGAGEPPPLESLDTQTMEPEDREYLDKKHAKWAEAEKNRAAKRAEGAALVKKVQDERTAKIEPKGKDSVTIDVETQEVLEPGSSEEALKIKSLRDPYEISTDDFVGEHSILTHERWSLNASDFRFDKPQYFNDDVRLGRGKRWFLFSYSATNSTTKSRRLAPIFVAVTDKGVFSSEVGGYLPQRAIADSLRHPLADSAEPRDTQWLAENVVFMESTSSLATRKMKEGGFKPLAAGEPMATFEPGQTRWGVAAWPDFNDEFTELKIVVHGLSNGHRYDRKQRRALVLTFERKDDEFHVERSNLRYKGKAWEYLWMWDQDISVPIPADPKDPQIKEKELATPAGGKRLLWTVPFNIENSSGREQTLTIKEIRFVLRGADNKGLEVDVGGQKACVEVQVVDDGRSSIYKAQILREQGKSSLPRDTNRFAPDLAKSKEPGGLVFKLEAGKKLEELPGVFDIQNVDWADVREQVESQLTMGLDKKALSDQAWKGKGGEGKSADRAPLYDPRRLLTDDTVTLNDGRSFAGEITFADDQRVLLTTLEGGFLEFAKAEVKSQAKGEMSEVKQKILAAIPAALQSAKAQKKVMAYFTCEVGLASGKYRISRSYRQPGKILEEEWLKAFESLDKPDK